MKNRKQTRKIFQLTVILCLLVSLAFSAFSLPASAESQTYPIDHNSPYYRELSSLGNGFNADAFTQYVYGEILSRKTDISLSADDGMRPPKRFTRNGETVRTVDAIFNWLFYDCPALFHIDNIGSTEQKPSTGRITAINVIYLDTASAYDEQLQACERTARSILKGVQGNNSLTEAQKALIIHDRLVNSCEYDKENLLAETLPKEVYTIYGALVNHSAVCEGYAKAYKYLLEKAGVYSYLCMSDDIDHAWNIVYIDGEPYHVDVTHDDPTNRDMPYNQRGRVLHENFLLNETRSRQLHATVFNTSTYEYDVDLIEEPTDNSYHNAYWRNVISEITLIDGDLYYCSQAGSLYRAPNTVITAFPFDLVVYDEGDEYELDPWPALITVGAYQDYFLYAQPDGIYGYHVKTGDIRQFLDVPLVNGLGGADHFYIFDCLDGVLTYDVYYTILFEDTDGEWRVKVGPMSMESTVVQLFDANEDDSFNILDLIKAKRILAGIDALYAPGDFIKSCGEINNECMLCIQRGLLEQ